MTLLASLGLFAWIVIAFVFFVIITTLVENEEGSWATVFILGMGIAFYFIGGKETFKEFFTFVGENVVGFIIATLVYVAAGIAYSFWRWVIFVKDQKEKKYAQPKAKTHKADLTRWIAYWAFSIWWTLLNEPLKALVDKLGKSYDNWAQKIYDKA